MTIQTNLIINPKNFLISLINKKILVRLKWGIEYKGILVSFDDYINIRISNTEEWINGKEIGILGEIIIRCNNIQIIVESK
nr:small nuclear ribonucleoprotein E-like [Cryptomonas curvata]